MPDARIPTSALGTPGLPVVFVDATHAPELTSRVLHLVVAHPSDGPGTCELVLDNWRPTDAGIGLALSDRRTLDCGRVLGIDLGGGTVFSGLINAIEERYSAQRAPQLVIHARTPLKVRLPTTLAPDPGGRHTIAAPADRPVPLALGQNLVDASLVRRSTEGHPDISGTATTSADARLRPGAVVHISGAAADFDGDYRVAAVQHIFDTITGGRSTIRVNQAANRSATR